MKVSRAFSFSQYAEIASRAESDFSDFGTVVKQGDGRGNTYTFKDNDSSVLGIAHVDTVQGPSSSSLIKVAGDKVLVSPVLDDRLGAYIITRLLPRLGIVCDWLLTTGEETGESSAELFRTDKQYNWAFSFDRSGTDVVLYQFESKALKRILRKSGFKVGIGSFSDLSFLDIGCSGINFGCGYHDNHSRHAYAVLSETFHMVRLFRKFWGKYSDVKLPFYRDAYWQRTSRYDYASYGSYRDDRLWNPNAPSYYTQGGYPDGYPDGLSATDRAYLDWYVSEEQMRNGELEDLADRAQSEDNGR